MDFYDAVYNRHSVRVFQPEPIPGAVLERILSAFRAAPSWANRQPWELVLATDPQIKAALQKTLSPGNPAIAAMTDAPIVVCGIGLTGLSGFYKGQCVTNRGDWVMFDLAIALEHLVLAAAAEGLGTVHVGYFDYESAGKILHLPPDRTTIELIPIGYPAHEPRPVPRKPLEDFVFTNKYGDKLLLK